LESSSIQLSEDEKNRAEIARKAQAKVLNYRLKKISEKAMIYWDIQN